MPSSWASSNAGLIPAHAGKTMRRARIRSSMRAHPRSRGENRTGRLCTAMIVGSSPLTRGKRGRSRRPQDKGWLIPAHAGKTEDVVGVCADCAGSSPLTRGKHLDIRRAVGAHGLIPAHAGKTTLWSTPGRCAGAHPRSRGENLPDARDNGGDAGSSPLTRGKRIRSHQG